MLSNNFIRRTLLCSAAALSLAFPRLASAQEGAPADGAMPRRESADAEESATFELRTYDVSDLILRVEDRPFTDSLLKIPSVIGGGGGMGGGMGGGGGGMFSVPGDEGRGAAFQPGAAHRIPRIQFAQSGGDAAGRGGMGMEGMMPGSSNGGTTQITMDELIRVMTNTIASDTWDAHGGAGKIEPLGTVLIVWQAPDVHEQIKKFLQEISSTFGDRRTLTVDARWLLLSSDDLAKLMPETKDAPAPVDRKVLEEFTRRAGSIRGITNSFSGQLVYIISGTMRNVVGGWIPVVGALERPELSDGLVSLDRGPKVQFVSDPAAGGRRSVGYQPIMTNLNLGALLEIRPTLIRRSEAVVDLKSTLTVSRDQIATEAPASAAPDALAPQVDRVAVETLQFATTLRMPLKTPVLVGGLTNMPGTASSGEFAPGSEEERPQLYLVLEIR